MELEEVFSSKTRIKILKLLNQQGQRNVSDIARRVKINYTAADKHLRLLEAEGLLKLYTYGKRFRLYSFNETAEKAKAVQNLIRAWEQNK
ncbi:MAG: winged helix-turn-helix domain-containing protein [Nitrososphaerota archaeon]|jgi:predicted ArsR family transcriptional regulator|nr:winged helix-turn-helix domain-containing protein [Nitrososphaerota archaeon]